MNTQKIAEIISNLERREYDAVKEYGATISDLREDGIKVGGVTIQKTLWAYLIWKPTDLGEQPQYKGEPVLKIVPVFIDDEDRIATILDAQMWTYI